MAGTNPIVLPDWGSNNTTSADQIQPTNSEILVGRAVGVKPTRQRENWELSYLFNGVKYLSENGIPAYKSDRTYPLYAVIQSGGLLYQSLQAANLGNTPSSSPTWWAGLATSNLVASVFNNTRAVVGASGDTTLLTSTFTLPRATNLIVNFRAWLGGNSSSQIFGNARLTLDGTQKSSSTRMHFGFSGAGYLYNWPFTGCVNLGAVSAGSHTVAVVWNNQTSGAAAVFNPNSTDSAGWNQSDSELNISAYS